MDRQHRLGAGDRVREHGAVGAPAGRRTAAQRAPKLFARQNTARTSDQRPGPNMHSRTSPKGTARQSRDARGVTMGGGSAAAGALALIGSQTPVTLERA